MEYAKDVIFNVKYDNGSNIIRLKREGHLKRFLSKIYENKLILTVLILTIILIIADTVLVSSFIKILSTLR